MAIRRNTGRDGYHLLLLELMAAIGYCWRTLQLPPLKKQVEKTISMGFRAYVIRTHILSIPIAFKESNVTNLLKSLRNESLNLASGPHKGDLNAAAWSRYALRSRSLLRHRCSESRRTQQPVKEGRWPRALPAPGPLPGWQQRLSGREGRSGLPSRLQFCRFTSSRAGNP